MRRLPPLNPLRVFETVARHESFAAAAADLFVTPGAVTRHVQALEHFYGVRLINRTRKGIVLTATGQLLLPTVRDAFDRIATVSERIKACHSELHLKAPNTFAARWLIGKLGRFASVCPQVRLRMTVTVEHGVDFSKEPYDAAIIYAPEEPAGVHTILLFVEQLYPVCSPALVPRATGFTVTELVDQCLLLATVDGRDWRRWGSIHGLPSRAYDLALAFDTDDTAIQAAVAGRGIALANLLYLENEFRLGGLQLAVDVPPASFGAHYFVCPKASAETSRILPFREWLVTEAAQSRASLETREIAMVPRQGAAQRRSDPRPRVGR